MLRRAVLQLEGRRRRPSWPAAVAEHPHHQQLQRPPATDTTLLLGTGARMGISGTALRVRQWPPKGEGLVPPASWSIHDLKLLKEDVAGQEEQQQAAALTPEEVGGSVAVV